MLPSLSFLLMVECLDRSVNIRPCQYRSRTQSRRHRSIRSIVIASSSGPLQTPGFGYTTLTAARRQRCTRATMVLSTA